MLSTAQRVFVDLGIERQGQKLDQAAANWVKTQPLFLTGTMPPLLVKEYYKAAYSPPDPVTQAAIEKIVTSPVSLEPITAEVAKRVELSGLSPESQQMATQIITQYIVPPLLYASSFPQNIWELPSIKKANQPSPRPTRRPCSGLRLNPTSWPILKFPPVLYQHPKSRNFLTNFSA
ncbi:MAG: hypothetical protein UX99_C0017G0011 [Candidatus Amesbacteria bacterium GW2011_GWB1_47_26]|nr:MAG: hypothetical protein UX99_C0017G0011 [Candidatus Amesbacteria bacterium GW2011_GWB1_47_26]